MHLSAIDLDVAAMQRELELRAFTGPDGAAARRMAGLRVEAGKRTFLFGLRNPIVRERSDVERERPMKPSPAVS